MKKRGGNENARNIRGIRTRHLQIGQKQDAKGQGEKVAARKRTRQTVMGEYQRKKQPKKRSKAEAFLVEDKIRHERSETRGGKLGGVWVGL